VVHLRGLCGEANGFSASDDRRRGLEEDERPLRHLVAQLACMLDVVPAYADDLRWTGRHRVRSGDEMDVRMRRARRRRVAAQGIRLQRRSRGSPPAPRATEPPPCERVEVTPAG